VALGSYCLYRFLTAVAASFTAPTALPTGSTAAW
jgi:hypothetical protein